MESGLLKAGRILLLMGAIMSAVGAAILIIAGMAFTAFGQALEEGVGATVVGVVYIVMGVVAVAGAVCGFLAYGRVGEGRLRNGWILGIASSLLPPLQAVTLIGAILVLASPEAQA